MRFLFPETSSKQSATSLHDEFGGCKIKLEKKEKKKKSIRKKKIQLLLVQPDKFASSSVSSLLESFVFISYLGRALTVRIIPFATEFSLTFGSIQHRGINVDDVLPLDDKNTLLTFFRGGGYQSRDLEVRFVSISRTIPGVAG